MPRRNSLAILAATLLTACSSDAPNAPREPFPPLTSQRWYVQTADGQALPALVAHRVVDGSLEQLFLDSATVDVTQEGTWTRRFWMQRFLGGERVGAEYSQIVGTWAATREGYEFVSEPGGRRFALRGEARDAISLSLPGLGTHDVIVAALGRTPVPPGPLGTWRLTAVHELPLPSTIYRFDNFEEDGVLKSIHLIADSARIVLHPNGTYTHRIDFSEWEGPNHGEATTFRYRWFASDFGSWTRSGLTLNFASGWIEGLRMQGEFAASGPLRMLHGISHEDEWVPWRYVRQ